MKRKRQQTPTELANHACYTIIGRFPGVTDTCDIIRKAFMLGWCAAAKRYKPKGKR